MDILQSLFRFLSGHFTGASHRTYWVFLLCALGLAFFVYLRREGREWSLAGFGRYVFDREVWTSRSARTDYTYFAVNAVVMVLLFGPLIAWVYPNMVEGFVAIFQGVGLPQVDGAPGWAWGLYIVAMIAIVDFCIFFAHYCQHKIPFLWQFHKTHHSAEVLNPMTLYRQHPLDFLLTGVLVGAGSAAIHASFSWIFSTPFTQFTLAGLGVVTLAFYVLGYNLRHSHIRLSFGPADRWFISPEQHQLHHSSLEHHFDKNMGLIFAVWDRLFGTHYIPARDEEIVMGLPDGESDDFVGAFRCYVQPILLAIRGHLKGLAVAVVALGSLVGLVSTSAAGDAALELPSVHLEELTWTEVEDAVQAGYTRVIIPTGGTEQNGPHVALGKHNRIIRRTTEEIAIGAGRTLVAPVMAYVPEGDISPPSHHMRYAGTISVRPEIFEAVLSDTARSLFAHGFTDVWIVGDSGDSVASQQRAADALQTDLEPGQSVVHLDRYYADNGQFGWLEAQGFSPRAVGWHAGLRDTSELIAVSPEDVRMAGMRGLSQNQGANGAYWRANAEIGEQMLRLKVEAALEQIAELEAE